MPIHMATKSKQTETMPKLQEADQMKNRPEKIFKEFLEYFIKIMKKYDMTHAETNYMISSLIHLCTEHDLNEEITGKWESFKNETKR